MKLRMIPGPTFALSALVALSISFASPLAAQVPHATPLPSAPTAVTSLARASDTVPESYFGLHIHRPAEDNWPQVPFRELRLWDSKGTIWYALEPAKGKWDFSQLDQTVKLAEEHHVGLLLTLGQTPPWAALRPDDPPAWRHGGASPPASEDDWTDYVRTVVTRYKGRIQAYEIWNEPNLKEFYTGDFQQLATLTKDAYQVIHQVDPQAVVVTPSITGAYGVGWLNHYLDYGGGKYADVIGYHMYSSPKAPESMLPVAVQVRAVLEKHGLSLPLWDTEAGYMIQSNFQQVQAGKGSMGRLLAPDEAIAYVMRSYILNWAAGVSRLYWYDWDSNQMGIGDNLGKATKPAASGYATIHRWLVGASISSCTNEGTVWTCELSRNGRKSWIAWSADQPATKPIPADWKIRYSETVAADGHVVDAPMRSGQDLNLGPIPILFTATAMGSSSSAGSVPQ